MCKFCGHERHMCNDYKTLDIPIPGTTQTKYIIW